MGVNIKYKAGLEKSDPREQPVTIIGNLEHLKSIPYSFIQTKFGTRVSQDIFDSALLSLHPSPTDSCPLYLNLATIVALPNTCSPTNTPSQAHSIAKIVKSLANLVNEYIVIFCEKKDAFASGCAVARAFPIYSRKASALSKDDSTVTVELVLVSKCPKTGEFFVEEELSIAELELLQNASFAIRNTAKIVDTPCNEMHTDQFVEEIKEIGSVLGITPQIIRGEELRERGFGGIYNVGKAAVHPPALVILSHLPPAATETVAWVGKGIVYDTGGLSIKSKTAMPSMKGDCGGAAGVLNAFYVAVKAGFTQNLHCILCLAENSVGPLSTRPDDVIRMYSGKSVEVNNTDAEGRLVLGDGVAYAKELGASIIVDMATLTGAQGIATGKYHAAVLTNSEEWEIFARKAGSLSGELAFPIVFAPELHFSEFNSPVADMKNSVADRSNALSSCAGLFIMSHIGFDFPGLFMHIDMASPVSVSERATGYGVALLNTLFGHYSSNPLLQLLSSMSRK